MRYFVLILSLLCMQNIITNPIHRSHPSNEKYNNTAKPLSLYNYYFIFKELCNALITYNFFINEDKVEKAQIKCCTCDYTVCGGDLWAYAAINAHEALLQDIMHLIYKESTQDLTLFLLTTYQDRQIPCDNCQEFYGWYIAESRT